MPLPIAVGAAVGAAARVVGPLVAKTAVKAARTGVGKMAIRGAAFRAGMNVMGAPARSAQSSNTTGTITEYSQ